MAAINNTKSVDKNRQICGHCRWLKRKGYVTCSNPDSDYYGLKIADDQNACIDYDIGNITVENVVEENTEQFGKDFIVSSKYVDYNYEDDRNVISVIINAISVRINMPRGTVKVLMACLVIMLIALLVMGFNKLDRNDTSDQSDEGADTETTREYASEEGKAVNTERAAKAGDYVIISSHYRYNLPEEVLVVWEPDDYYAENETFCGFNSADHEYTIRSYLLEYSDADLAEIVKANLSQFDNMKFLDEQYIEGKYGDVLSIKFEATDEDGLYTAGTGYYWYESDPKICCLEISSDDWHDEGTEEKILDSVYRVSSDTNVAPPDAEEIWQEQQKEEAMNSLVEDSMKDYYEPEPEQDPLFD